MFEDTRGAINVVYWVFKGLGTCVTPFIRRDFGVNGIGSSGLVAFLIIIFYGGERNAPEIVLYLMAWLAALFWRKSQSARNERKGRAEHSQYDGWPWLAMKIPFVKSEQKAKSLEPFVCFFGGGFICPISETIGTLVMLSAFGLLLARVIDLRAHETRVRRMRDAMIEMELISRDLRRFR